MDQRFLAGRLSNTALAVALLTVACSSETGPVAAAGAAGNGGSAGVAGASSRGGAAGTAGTDQSSGNAGSGGAKCSGSCDADFPCFALPAKAFCVDATSYRPAQEIPCRAFCPNACSCSGGGCKPASGPPVACPQGEFCVARLPWGTHDIGKCEPGVVGKPPGYVASAPCAETSLGRLCSEGDQSDAPLCVSSGVYSLACTCVKGETTCEHAVPTVNAIGTAVGCGTDVFHDGDPCSKAGDACTFASEAVTCPCGVEGKAYASCACNGATWACNATKPDDCSVRCATAGTGGAPP